MAGHNMPRHGTSHRHICRRTARGVLTLILISIIVTFYLSHLYSDKSLQNEVGVDRYVNGDTYKKTTSVDLNTELHHSKDLGEKTATKPDQLDHYPSNQQISQRGLIEYTRLSKKGAALNCLLLGTTSPRPTPFKTHTDLASWGWTLQQRTADYTYVSNELNKNAGINVGTLSSGDSQTWSHTNPTTHTTTLYPPTNAVYTNIFYPSLGVILAQSNYGPDYMTTHNLASIQPWVDASTHQPLPIVNLKNWSDIVFLTWQALTTPTERQNLRWVLRRIIQNPQTKDIIGTIALFRGIKPKWKGVKQGLWKYQAPVWPGMVVREGEKGFEALLATPNAKGVVWLLVQHREEMGWRTIRSVRVWNDAPVGDFYTPSMLVEIGGREEGVGGEGG